MTKVYVCDVFRRLDYDRRVSHSYNFTIIASDNGTPSHRGSTTGPTTSHWGSTTDSHTVTSRIYHGIHNVTSKIQRTPTPSHRGSATGAPQRHTEDLQRTPRPSHRGSANVRVSVTNVNDEDPVFIQPVEHVLVSATLKSQHYLLEVKYASRSSQGHRRTRTCQRRRSSQHCGSRDTGLWSRRRWRHVRLHGYTATPFLKNN